MIALMALLAVAVAPEKESEVKLEHEFYFLHVTETQAQDWREAAVRFQRYATHPRQQRYIKEDVNRVSSVYCALWSLKSPSVKDRPKDRLSALQQLFKFLGKEAFAKGKLPPPVPAKYKKEFDAWVAGGMPPPPPVTPAEVEKWVKEDRGIKD